MLVTYFPFRFRALLPKLPHVFAALLDSQEVPRMSWSDAKRVIHAHALFDEYFHPLGVLGTIHFSITGIFQENNWIQLLLIICTERKDLILEYRRKF